jgi:hypothetical protein
MEVFLESSRIMWANLYDIQLGRGWFWLYKPQVHRFYWRFGKVGRYGFGIRPYRYKNYNEST